jgi:hypothetical protein
MARLRLSGPLVRDGEVRRLVARHQGRVVDASYGEGEEAIFIIEVPEAATDRLRAQLGVVCRGSWKVADGG